MTVNLLSKRRAVGDLDVVLSMTTFGRRTNLVYLAIESIVRGPRRPKRIILWLDEKAAFDNPPATLRRLASRGLEIRLTENYGPHKKLYPAAVLLESSDTPVATCDDDVLYPSSWISDLLDAYHDDRDAISGFRARVMEVEDGAITPYVTWPMCRSTEPSFRHVLTNVSGCVYPPKFVAEVRRASTEFMQVSPTADDLWLHHLALRHGFRCRQATLDHMQLPVIPGSQTTSLQNVNIDRSENDAVVRRLYDEADIAVITAENDRTRRRD